MRLALLTSNRAQAANSPTGKAETSSKKPKAIVIGAGWAGLASAHALQKAGAEVTLLEAADSVGGLSSAARTKKGRSVEPGIKGFWHQYQNIEALIRELDIPNALTDWSKSSFYTPQGLQVQAPIFRDYPRLPTPLGSFIYTAPYFTELSLLDRLTAVSLIKALLEYDTSEQTYLQYDAMTAKQLFSSVSPALYRDFLNPILLVTLFLPGDKLSAAAALGALYYFALANQAAFDVRWCRGPVGEVIIKPWAERLQSCGVQIETGQLVQEVQSDTLGKPSRIVTKSKSSGAEQSWEADVLVVSAPIPALQRIVQSSPLLAQRREFSKLNSLTTVDVMAVRLWLDRRIAVANPSNVAVNFDEGVGATFFDLTTLQDEYKNEPGSVIEVDFYNASSLLGLSDEEAVQCALRRYLQGSLPAFASAVVQDYNVTRGKGAVTAFSRGSAAYLPAITTSFDNLFLAGDFVAQGPGTHGAKGLSQEKAYVAGLQAGNLAAAYLGLEAVSQVIPAEADEPHVRLGKEFVQQLNSIPAFFASLA